MKVSQFLFVWFICCHQVLMAHPFDAFFEIKKPPSPITNALWVAKDNQTIYEKYANGYQADSKHALWSISKSIQSLILTRAITLGFIKLEDSICKYLTPQYSDQCKVNVENLMTFTSGFDFNEGYERDVVHSSTVVGFMYGPAFKDAEQLVMRYKFRSQPGTEWFYNSADGVLLSAVLRTALKEQYENFAWSELFSKLGIVDSDVSIERDKKGLYLFSTSVFMSARALAKIGQFMLDQNQKLIDPKLIKWLLTTPTAANQSENVEWDHVDWPLTLWWSNRSHTKLKPESKLPQMPKDLFFAQGHWGQMLTIFPSQNLIVIRFGDDRGGIKNNWQEFYNLIWKEIQK